MSGRDLVLLVWAVLAVGLVGCAFLPLVTRGRFASLRVLTRRMTRRRVALMASFLGWLWIGWHFFAR